jgi:hypothetical protein
MDIAFGVTLPFAEGVASSTTMSLGKRTISVNCSLSDLTGECFCERQ